jgi:type I restriction enzyme S subunit
MDIVEMKTAHPKQFKDSPLGRIPTNWEVTSLGKSFDELYRYPTYYGIEYVESGIPEVRGELIKADGTIEENSENFRYISRETADRFPRVHLEPGDFVMSVRGTMGKVAIVPERLRGAVITANLIRMKFAKSVVVPEWARHFLCSEFFQDALDLATSATTIRTIQVPELCAIAFRRPPINEQCHIAEILDTIDEAIQETEVLISKLKAMKQGLLHDLLTRGLDKNGKLRDPKAHPEQFKDSPLGRIPNEWEVVNIESIGANKPHAIVDGPFGSNLKSIHYRKKGVPVIQSGFVTNGEFIASEYVYVDKALFQVQRRSTVVPGDIVMAKIGAQCGTCAILPEGHSVGILARNSLKISTNPDRCRTLFLLRVLHRYYQIGLMDKVITETAQPAISLKNLRAMLIPLPSLMEQDSIVSNLNFHDARIHTEEQYRDKLKLQKKGLMHDLLTGKVRVQGITEWT